MTQGPPPMQVNLNDDREAIARIIDPKAWGQTVPPIDRPSLQRASLAKADAILALRTKEPSRG